MRWLRISLFSLAGIVALLLTAIALLFTVDFGRFKERIEITASDFLGRELRIDGELHAYLGANIEVYLEDLYLANPEWANGDAFVTAEKIDIAVDMWSLINGPIELARVEIDGVRVNIEKNESGAASWSFAALAADPDEAPVDEAPVGEEPVVRLPVMLDYAAVNDVQVSYTSPTMAQPLLFVVQSLISSIDGSELSVNLTGSLNGTPLHFEKTTGTIENLLEYKDVTVDLKGNIGDIEIRGSAWADDLLSPRRPKIKLNVEGPNAQYLTDMLMMEPVTTGPLDLSIEIQESGDHMVASLEAVFGEFNFGVNGHFKDIQELSEIQLDVVAGGPDIGSIIRLTGREYEESDPFSVRGKIVRSGEEVTIAGVLVSIGESRLTVDGFFPDFPGTDGANLSLVASGPDYGRFNRLLGLPGRLGGAFTTSLKLLPQDDGRTAVELDANAEDIRVQLYSLLSASEEYADSTLQLNISGADIGIVAEAAGLTGLPAEPFEIAGNVDKDRAGYRLRNVRALVGDDLIQIDGHIGNRPIEGETDVEIGITGSDLGASMLALGASAEHLPKGAYHLTGRVQNQDGKFWIREVEAVIGDNSDYQFELSGFLTVDQEFQDSRISVRAKGASLAALAELARLQGVPDFPFEIKADIRRGSSSTFFENGWFSSGIVKVEFGGYVGDKPLEDDLEFTFKADVPRMKNVIAEFGVAADQIPMGDLVASGTLRNKAGNMSLQRLVATFEGTELNASGHIGKLPALDGTKIKFSFSGEDLSRLLPPGESGDALAHDFAVEGQIALQDGHLEVDRLKANVGLLSLGGEARFALQPLLGSGSISLKADSPNLFQLVPELKDISARRVAKMKFRGAVDWSDNYWKFDDVELQLGEGFIAIDGGLDGPPSFARTDLNVEWQAANIRNMSRLAGRELPDHPVHLVARLVGTDEVMTLEDFALTFGASDLQGEVTMRSGDVPTVKIEVSSNLFDISEYLPEPEPEPEPGAKAEQNPAPPAQEKDPEVIPDTPLPLELLRSLNADIAIEIGELRTRTLIEKGISVNARLSDGALKIRNASLISQRGGYLKLSAELVPDDAGGAEFSLVADGEDLVLGFIAETDEDLQQLPLLALHAELAGSGATIKDLAGSLDGYFRLVGGAGRVRPGSFSMFTQDFVSEVANAVNPFAKKDPYTNVECSAILLRFDDGVVKGKPAFVRQTEKLRIFAGTEINLKTEALDADFKMVPRKGIGISVSGLVNPYIKVIGTLGTPALVVDPESLLIEGGIAVATGGLSILAKSFKDRFLSEKDPCGKAVADFDASLASAQTAD